MINFTINQKYQDILDLIQQEFGEIGNFIIEENYASFEIYRGYYEDAPKFLQIHGGGISLKLVEKFDDPFFTLCYKITIKNNRQTLSGQKLTFDVQTQEIKQENTLHNYTGRKEKINILPRLIKKYRDNKAFETHLQAYVVQNVGSGTNKELDKCLLNGLSFEWLGNEVSCGVGMQRIDVMLSLVKGNVRIILPIELKSIEASTDNVIQLQRYVDWLEQYYIPNRISDIQPVLISKKIINTTSENYKKIIESFRQFNKKNSRCMPIKYIEYELVENNLKFQEINY